MCVFKKTQVFADFQKTQVKKAPKSTAFGWFYYISSSKNSGYFQKTQVLEYRRICWYSGKCTNKKPVYGYYTSDFSHFLSRKITSTFFAFSRKNRCKKVRKKYGLKTPTFGQNWAAIQWNFGRITNFLPFTSKCLPQKCSLFLKSQFTPTFSLILYRKKH